MKTQHELRSVFVAILVIVAISVFAPLCYAERGYIVFADSQGFVCQDCDKNHNWPHLLQEMTGYHFFNMSRGGRKLADGHVADYLRMANIHRDNQQADTIFIALGSLDALWGTDPVPALMDAVQEAEAREMRVICLLPPDNALWSVEAMRETLKTYCPISIDMSDHVTPDMMPDGVHIGEEGHIYYALGLAYSMLLNSLY